MQGLHLIGDLTGCQCSLDLLTSRELGEGLLLSLVEKVNLSCVGKSFYQFPNGGYTGLVLLAESHLAIHTWPEMNKITLDVYVCNHENDNSGKATQLFEEVVGLFQPQEYSKNALIRGDHFLMEPLTDTTGMWIKSPKLLTHKASPMQTVQIYETPDFGTLMQIDHLNMTSDVDEFFYHEPLVHPALCSIDNPEEVLIIGGGDGGCLEEVLKYASLKKATMVEIDKVVVEVAKKWLPKIHRGSFDNPKTNLVFADGAKFMAENRQQYDAVLMDVQDPMAITDILYQDAFIEQARNALKPGGQLVMHLGSPLHHAPRWKKNIALLSKYFNALSPYTMSIPLYGGIWGMIVCSNTPGSLADTQTVSKRIAQQGLKDLQFYNGETHQALFALPNYVKRILETS